MTFESSIKNFDAAIAKIFDSADMVFDAAANMIFKFTIEISEFAIITIKIFEFAIMTLDSVDMVFVTAVVKKFDLLIDKKFDPAS
jgi:hypothetical protein